MPFVQENFFGSVNSIWFTDKDDGTLIHIFDGGGSFDATTGTRCPLPDFLFEQNKILNSCDELDGGEDEEIACPGTGTTIRGDFKLDIDPTTPLPADHSFSSGSISRFDDRLTMYIEEFTPSRVGESTTLIGIQKSDPVRTFITRYDFINTESLGNSDGSSSQVFTVSGSKILVPTKGTPIIFVGGIADGDRWSVTDDLSTAGATATVFEYDETTGTVTFGDGTNGAIPENGQEIVLRITIRNGGGQWTFIGIVEPQKPTKNLGGIKSIKDKIIYVQTGIALADAGKMTSVVATLNFVERRTYRGIIQPDKLMRIERRYTLAYGGDVDATGGEIILTNVAGSGFVEKEPPGGTSALVIDTGVVYPSFKASTQPAVVPDINPDPTYIQTAINGGVHTSPKIYETPIDIDFIFDVQEIQNFRTISGPNLLDDLFYTLNFTADNGGGFPIGNDRDKRLIKIGDPTPPAGMLKDAVGEEWTGGIGTFEDSVQTGTFVDLDGPSSIFGQKNQVIVTNGSYSQILVGSSDRHLDFITIEIECRQSLRDAALATHIRGSALSDFVYVCTFVEGSVTILPTIIA